MTLRIVCVCRAYPTHRPGGMPHVCQDRARALVAAGHEVTVVTTGLDGEQERRVLDDQGVQVVHTAVPAQRYGLAFARACHAEVRRVEPDVVHLDSFDRRWRWWEEVEPRVPVVVTMHGFGFGAWLTAWNCWRAAGAAAQAPEVDWRGLSSEAESLSRFDLVLAISKHEAWMLSDCYGLGDKVRLVPNPIAPCFFREPRKALCATSSTASRPFVCIGNPGTSGNRRFDLARLAGERAGVKIRVLTGMPREQVAFALDESAGLLLPTMWSQGSDLAVAEALARRRPVIVTGTGSYWHMRAPWIRRVPVVRDDRLVRDLAGALSEVSGGSPLPVPADAADRHRPKRHVSAWLDAVQEVLP